MFHCLKLAMVTALLHSAVLPASAARDRFDYDPTPAAPATPKTPSRKTTPTAPAAPKAGNVLAVGEVREVFDAATAPDMAFYVPETTSTIVQVIVEKKFLKKPVYFIKAIRPGTVTGGIVPKAYLDKSGFKANNILDQARAEAAIKRQPITLIVR